MVHENFKHALARRYEDIKAQIPTEGRRKWRLRVLYESWPAISSGISNADIELRINSSVTSDSDSDSFDQVVEDDELGLILRTDFTNDDAWKAFCRKVQTAQKELISEITEGGADINEGGPPANDDTVMGEGSSTIPDDGDSDSSKETPDIMKIFDPSEQLDRIKLTNISNLTALRMFNDVDIRPAPSPTGTKRISPQNPLIDQGGWQEIYTGKNIWIYDSRSNTDECARVVSQTGDFYGTATGDSWRARASHICELQFSMSYQGMKIDFNGQDRWDWEERARNLRESLVL